MALSRRTSPAQVTRQAEWTQPPTEDTLANDARGQYYEQNSDRRDPARGREISEITCKHFEQVISTMIPSSTCSSSDPTESAPVNSMVTQPSDKDTEELEVRKTLKEGEKQVIVNNYYISDKEIGWKQILKSEIPANIPGTLGQTTPSEISLNHKSIENSIRKTKVGHE